MRGLRSTKNVAFLHASVVRSLTATDVTDLHDSVMFPEWGACGGICTAFVERELAPVRLRSSRKIGVCDLSGQSRSLVSGPLRGPTGASPSPQGQIRPGQPLRAKQYWSCPHGTCQSSNTRQSTPASPPQETPARHPSPAATSG